ncbi:hypothetical protein RvY_04400-2 [Ramazzottius varieornatus]|nr:hypothetical protein RvY_04400-2 [Ramazzottius varieornatus]
MMPYKPPTNGIYPFYPNCFTKNFTTQFFCYTPRFHDAAVDSFITAFFDNEFSFNLYRPFVDDSAPYKCCKAPTGYYIDYSSCYYMPTHDQFWEYYDSPIQLSGGYFLVYCATGYVMTGLAKKAHPVTQEYHIEWIQCCRLGFGPREKLLAVRIALPRPPPVASSYSSSKEPIQSSYSGGVPNQAYADSGYSPAPYTNVTQASPTAGLGGPFDGVSGKARTPADLKGIFKNLDGLAINPQKPTVKT